MARKLIICSAGSRAKDPWQYPLPARLRYTGSHIAKVARTAHEEALPFYILSGVYGLVAADDPIPYYDHLLSLDEVGALAAKIVSRLLLDNIHEVRFCTKAKLTWMPYTQALVQSTKWAKVLLSVHVMRDDD